MIGAGLKPGENIISEGQMLLMPGAKVRVLSRKHHLKQPQPALNCARKLEGSRHAHYRFIYTPRDHDHADHGGDSGVRITVLLFCR